MEIYNLGGNDKLKRNDNTISVAPIEEKIFEFSGKK